MLYGSINQESCVEFTTVTAKVKCNGTSVSVVEDLNYPLLNSVPVTIPINAAYDAAVTTAKIVRIVPTAIYDIQPVCREKQYVFSKPEKYVQNYFYYE